MQREKEEAERKAKEAERRRKEDAERAAQAEDARWAEEAEEAQAASEQVSGEAAESATASVAGRTEPPPPAPDKSTGRRTSAKKTNASPRRRSSTKKVATPNSTTKKAGRREPPAEHRFKPGQSGNPAGRPKGSRNKVTRGGLARVILEEAARIEPGQSGVSVHRKVIRTVAGKAIGGCMTAASLYVKMTAEAEAEVADLDEAAAAQEQEAREREERLAARQAEEERRRAQAAEDDALARRLAVEDPELYRLARSLSPCVAPGADNSLAARPAVRFKEAVERVRANLALGRFPLAPLDRCEVEAILAKLRKKGADNAAQASPSDREIDPTAPRRAKGS